MKRAMVAVAMAVVLHAAGSARAAGLDDADYRRLSTAFGLGQDSATFKDMTDDERADLHRILNDPHFAEYPKAQSDNAADDLYQVHLRECQSWSQANGNAHLCRPSGTATVDRGQDLAERRCNYCHLFGTTDVPSFHKMAGRGDVSAQRLADALDHGHLMSPIRLEPDEIAALAAYIVSLK